jgi:carbon monoxide dehydrogenase subunit G
VQFDNEFVVEAPVDRVWDYLLDVERIAPCAPGAELTEIVDDKNWKGKINIKVGPVAMSFAGTVTLLERDDAAHRAVLKAEGRERSGRGAASATVTSRLEQADGGTKVTISTDLTISGAAAQYGRGMIPDVSKRLTRDFADCLRDSIGGQGGSTDPPGPGSATAPSGSNPGSSERRSAGSMTRPVAGKPVKGLRLAAWALWRAIVRAFKRLFGRSSS